MLQLGRLNILTIAREVDFGLYLEDADAEEVLLPRRYVPTTFQIGDSVEVFVYLDSEDRLVATTKTPYAMVDQFALLQVVSIASVGAFLDWGLPKDLLVPFREQKPRMQIDQFYMVRVYVDDKTNRIVASPRLDRFLDDHLPLGLWPGKEVDLLVCRHTDIGYKVIVNGSFWAVLFDSDVFQPLTEGQRMRGFIKKLRDDKGVDVSIQRPGHTKVNDLSEMIVQHIKDQGGSTQVTDRSSPDIIRKTFGVSKKAYKMTIGSLYKKRIIRIQDNEIHLANPK